MVPSYEKEQVHSSKTAGRSKQSLPSSTNERHSLYLRFPKKLKSDRTIAMSEVKLLNSKIIQVRIPRQKSANYCLVDFDSKEDMEKAAKKLKKIQINDKHLVVKDAVRNDPIKVAKKSAKIEVKRAVNVALNQLVGEIKKSLAKDYRKRSVTNGVIVKALRKGVAENDVRRSFPHAIDVKMNIKPTEKNSFALIWLPTPKEAKIATKKKVKINDDEYVVRFQKDIEKNNKSETNDEKSIEDDGDSSSEDASEESD